MSDFVHLYRKNSIRQSPAVQKDRDRHVPITSRLSEKSRFDEDREDPRTLRHVSAIDSIFGTRVQSNVEPAEVMQIQHQKLR